MKRTAQRPGAATRTLSIAMVTEGLTPTERLLLVVLAHDARDGRRVKATMPALAKAVGVSESTAMRAVRRLQALELVHRMPGQLSEYEIHMKSGGPYDWDQMTAALQQKLPTTTHKLVLAYCAWRGRGGSCLAMQKTIARDLGLSRSMVSRCMAELIRCGLLQRAKTTRTFNTPWGTEDRVVTVHRLCLPRGRGRVVQHRTARPKHRGVSAPACGTATSRRTPDTVDSAPVSAAHPPEPLVAPAVAPSSRSTHEPSRSPNSFTTFTPSTTEAPSRRGGGCRMRPKDRRYIDEVIAGADTPTPERLERIERRTNKGSRPIERLTVEADAHEAATIPAPQGRARPVADWDIKDLVEEFRVLMQEIQGRRVIDDDLDILAWNFKVWRRLDGMNAEEIHDAIDHFTHSRDARTATNPMRLFVRERDKHARKTHAARVVRDEARRAAESDAAAEARKDVYEEMTEEERVGAHTREWLETMSRASARETVADMPEGLAERYGLMDYLDDEEGALDES